MRKHTTVYLKPPGVHPADYFQEIEMERGTRILSIKQIDGEQLAVYVSLPDHLVCREKVMFFFCGTEHETHASTISFLYLGMVEAFLLPVHVYCSQGVVWK